MSEPHTKCYEGLPTCAMEINLVLVLTSVSGGDNMWLHQTLEILGPY
jgi:hypothetical protein